jgi:hypothetical protein
MRGCSGSCHVKAASTTSPAAAACRSQAGKTECGERERQNYGISAHESCMSTDPPEYHENLCILQVHHLANISFSHRYVSIFHKTPVFTIKTKVLRFC